MRSLSEYEIRIAEIDSRDWDAELQRSADRYHVIGAWVAVVFDPLFGITDYLNFPDVWEQVFVLRIATTLLTLLAIYLHSRGKLSTYNFIFVPIFMISLHGSYTFGIIGPENLLGHNLNFLVMFMGAGLFALWPLKYSLVAFSFPVVGSMVFTYLNDDLTFVDFVVNGGQVLLTGAVFATLLINARHQAQLRELKALLVSQVQREEIENKSQILAEQAEGLAVAKTKIEAANAQLTRQNEMLEDTVDQRTATLRKTSAERDQLVYRLSHDFRTPIVNIRQILNLAESKGSNFNLQLLVERISQSLDHFDGLVLDMASFPIYARVEIIQEQINIEQLLHTIWDGFASVLQSGDVLEINNQLTRSVVTDSDKFNVIAKTIISNAVHFRQDDQPVELKISLLETDQLIEIQFKDNGIGIAPKVLPKVFDIFFRGSGRSKGVGLGLYLAQGITTQLGGEIALASTAGVGTTVTVTIANLAMT